MAYLWGAPPRRPVLSPHVTVLPFFLLSPLFSSSLPPLCFQPSNLLLIVLLPPSPKFTLASFCPHSHFSTFNSPSSLPLYQLLPHLFVTYSFLFNLYLHLVFIPPHFSSFQPQFIFRFISSFQYLPPSHLDARSSVFSPSFVLPLLKVHLYSTPIHISLSLDYISIFFCAFVHLLHP